ncbi:MAG TPA: protocatechuate 3,4-dioxygenase subunit beta [Candidatus Binataceae bacterium]|nr:protocatechuate 3,4-dioxygenase subunit beta [Candidatus Binataceae bacterium]
MSELNGYRHPAEGINPPRIFPGYESTVKRGPKQPLVKVEPTLSEITGPNLGKEYLRPGDLDMTHYNGGEAVGQRIIVTGHVLDEDGRPVRDALLEIWQANSCGRYHNDGDQHDAPLDPHFYGKGAVVTDGNGEYRFVTIKPGAYPWRNHYNAWRPNHIHYSIFGAGLATRLITQMYFSGDPLLPLDPIFNSVPDAQARQRLLADLDMSVTVPESALGYRFDIVLRGRNATPTGI